MPANFHPDISKTVACGRVLKFKKRNSSTFEATPPSTGGSGAKNFFCLFFPGSGPWLPYIFRSKSWKKIWGKKFPQGVWPPNFLEKWMCPPKGNVHANFHPYISKTVACGRWRKTGGQTNKKKNRQTCRCPAKTGSPIAVTHIPLDRGGGTYHLTPRVYRSITSGFGDIVQKPSIPWKFLTG